MRTNLSLRVQDKRNLLFKREMYLSEHNGRHKASSFQKHWWPTIMERLLALEAPLFKKRHLQGEETEKITQSELQRKLPLLLYSLKSSPVQQNFSFSYFLYKLAKVYVLQIPLYNYFQINTKSVFVQLSFRSCSSLYQEEQGRKLNWTNTDFVFIWK